MIRTDSGQRLATRKMQILLHSSCGMTFSIHRAKIRRDRWLLSWFPLLLFPASFMGFFFYRAPSYPSMTFQDP